MRKLNTFSLSVLISALLLAVLFSIRPEYFVIKHVLLGLVLLAGGVALILAYLRKEAMRLHLMKLIYGEDEGMRLFAAICGGGILVFYIWGILAREFSL